MGLFDRFRSKKSKQKTDSNYTELSMPEYKTLFYQISKMMQCNENELSLVDMLSIQSFICATLERKSEYVSANTVCRIETAIYTCFKLYSYLYLEIKSRDFADEFADEFIDKYTSAISAYFQISLYRTTKLINNRFDIYSKAVKVDYDINDEDVIFEYKQMLLSDIDLSIPCLFNEDEPLVVSSFNNDFMCQTEIASYNKLITTACKNIIIELINYNNN